MRRALGIEENATRLNNLSALLQDMNHLSEAVIRRSVEIFERSLGPDHPKTRIAQENLAALLEEIANQGPPPPAPGGGDSV